MADEALELQARLLLKQSIEAKDEFSELQARKLLKESLSNEITVDPIKREVAQSRARSIQNQRTGPILAISKEVGVPTDFIDLNEGGNAEERTKISFADTDEEVEAQFKQLNQNGLIARVGGRLVFVRDKDAFARREEKLKTLEGFGLEKEDLSDLAGPAIVAIPAAIAAFSTGGQSLVAQAGTTALTAATADLVKQGIQAGILDTNKQTLGEIAAQSLKVGTGEAALAAITFGGTRAASTTFGKRGLIRGGNEELSELIENVNKAKDSGSFDAPELLAQQASDSPFLQRSGAQATSTTRSSQDILASQQSFGADVVDTSGRLGEVETGTRIFQIGKKQLERERKKAISSVFPVATREQSGELIQKKVREEVIPRSKARVTRSFRSVQDIANKNDLTFDISLAQEKAINLSEGIRSIEGQRVSPLNGQLSGLLDELTELGQNQNNFEVVKQLRTRVGDLIEDAFSTGDTAFNSGAAKSLYRALSDTLENPIGTGNRAFKIAIKSANSEAREHFQILELNALKKIYKEDNVQNIVDNFGKPDQLGPLLRESIDKFSPEGGVAFRQGIINRILRSGNPVEEIDVWKNSYPEQWRWLTRGSTREGSSLASDLEKAGRNIQILNSSNVAKAVEEGNRSRQVIDNLLNTPGTKIEDINLAKGLINDEDLLRKAVYEDLIDASVSQGATGKFVLDKTAFKNKLRAYKDSGVWDGLLDADDKIKFKGLESYLQIISRQGSDPGVSLEAAQAFTDLKAPSTFLSGVHKIGVNKLIATVYSSKVGKRILLGNGKKQFKNSYPASIAILSEGLVDGLELGDASIIELGTSSLQGTLLDTNRR